MVSDRLVFFFPGFEPLTGAQHMERFRRACARTGPEFQTEIALEAAPGDDPQRPVFHAEASGADWRTRTEVVFCDWGDIILAYAARPAFARLLSGFSALAGFVGSGTALRYVRTSWRYGFFFTFPVLILFGYPLIGLLAAWAISGTLGWGPSLIIAAVATVTFVARAFRRLHILTAMDDWTLARDLVRGDNPELVRRIAAHGDALAMRLGEERHDEVIVAAHSLGASLATTALSQALKVVKPHPNLHILTVGSSLPKIGLHPQAERQRAAVRHLVTEARIPWTDCQSLSDVINFYKSNPATTLGIEDGLRPVVRRVHFRRLLTPETYRRVKRDFFRLHRQFVLGIERRSPYSFHMLLLGPHPLSVFTQTASVDHPPLAQAAGKPGRQAPQ